MPNPPSLRLNWFVFVFMVGLASFKFVSPVFANPLPVPPSQEEFDRLRAEGMKNQLRYGSGGNSTQSAPTKTPVVSKTLPAELEAIFYGPKTTQAANITDWSKVEKFTLDTEWNFTLVVQQPLNLTDANIRQAITAIPADWRVTRWDISVPETWWKKYNWQTPFTVTFHNSRLTKFAPELLSQTYKTSELPVITTSPTGELQFVIDKPVSLTMGPRVEITAETELATDSNTINLQGKTSHRDISLSILNTTTKERRAALIPDIQADGSFNFTIYDLQQLKSQSEKGQIFSYHQCKSNSTSVPPLTRSTVRVITSR